MAKKKVIVLEQDLLDSDAFRALTSNAKDVLMRFMKKRRLVKIKKPKRNVQYIISNNGEICFPYAEAVKMGISRATFARIIDALVENGLIDIAHSGNGGVKGDVSLYAISERWRKFGTEEYKKARRHKDSRQGESLRKYHREKKDKFQN